MIQNRNFRENWKNRENFQCVLKIIHFLSKFRRKILIFEEIRAFSILQGFDHEKGPKFDDVIGGHGRGPKFENLFSHALE